MKWMKRPVAVPAIDTGDVGPMGSVAADDGAVQIVRLTSNAIAKRRCWVSAVGPELILGRDGLGFDAGRRQCTASRRPRRLTWALSRVAIRNDSRACLTAARTA